MSSQQQQPTFAGISLHRRDGAACAGAAFELQDAARESEMVLVDGWEAELIQGVRAVVVRGGTASSYETALRLGLAHAQKALDLMSFRGGNNLVIKAFDDNHLAWWTGVDGVVIRIVSFAHLPIDVPPATITGVDASGNIVPPTPAPPLAWHESFRYFRLSQTTDDLFDAYRNAYLALESVLSSIAPQMTASSGRVTEREGDWFKRALAEAGKMVPLSSFAPSATADPVQHLFDELYVSMRSAMSHAKSGRKVLLPQDEAERKDVTRSLVRLVGLYLRLAKAHLGASRSGGLVTAFGFREMFSPFLERMTVYVSDDESKGDKSDTSPNPAGGAMEVLEPMGAPDVSESFVVKRIWSAPCAALNELPFVRRAVGVRGNVPSIAEILEGRLVLGSAQRLEVMLGARGSNTRQPRERYSY